MHRPPIPCIDSLILANLPFKQYWLDLHMRTWMHEESSRVSRRQHLLLSLPHFLAHFRRRDSMSCTPQLIIAQPLQQIRNIDHTRSWYWRRRHKLTGMEWIDFQSAYRILEEDCAESEICVWIYASVTFRGDSGFGDGHIVEQPKLLLFRLATDALGDEEQIKSHAVMLESSSSNMSTSSRLPSNVPSWKAECN